MPRMPHDAGAGDARKEDQVDAFPRVDGQGGQAVGPRSGETKGDETSRSILPGPSLARAYADVGKSTNYFGTPKSIFLSVGFHSGKLPSLSKLSTMDTTAPVNPVPLFRPICVPLNSALPLFRKVMLFPNIFSRFS